MLQYKQAISKTKIKKGNEINNFIQKSIPQKSLNQNEILNENDHKNTEKYNKKLQILEKFVNENDQTFEKIKIENKILNETIHKNTENHENKLQTLEKRLTTMTEKFRNSKKMQMKKCENCEALKLENEVKTILLFIVRNDRTPSCSWYF